MVEERTAQLREAVDQLEYRLLERKRAKDELRESKQLVAILDAKS